jgi:hypothetical protein
MVSSNDYRCSDNRASDRSCDDSSLWREGLLRQRHCEHGMRLASAPTPSQLQCVREHSQEALQVLRRALGTARKRNDEAALPVRGG